MSKLGNDTLTETRNHLLNEINLLSDDQFNWIANRDSWSIAQVCHHLVLVEEATIKAISWGLKAGDFTQTEYINVERLILDRTKKRIAPKIVEPSLESIPVKRIKALLNESRNKLLTLLSTVEDKSILTKKSMKHPALGEITLNQWVDQIYFHEQRHIEQIKEIKALFE
ncbi:MAG: DinB family protein [Solibacillus sp.]